MALLTDELEEQLVTYFTCERGAFQVHLLVKSGSEKAPTDDKLQTLLVLLQQYAPEGMVYNSVTWVPHVSNHSGIACDAMIISFDNTGFAADNATPGFGQDELDLAGDPNAVGIEVYNAEGTVILMSGYLVEPEGPISDKTLWVAAGVGVLVAALAVWKGGQYIRRKRGKVNGKEKK